MTQIRYMALRMKVAALLFVCIFGYVTWVLYQVQITRHEELLAKAKDRYTVKKVQTGKRGEIYDYNGNLLVGNIPTVDIHVDPSEVGEEAEAQVLAKFFVRVLKDYKVDYNTIYKRLMDKEIEYHREDGTVVKKKRRYAVIAQHLEYDYAQRLKLLVAHQKYKGVYFRDSSKRNYPKNEMLANILGYTNIDRDNLVAVVGLEKFYDKKMKADTTTSFYERTRDGIPLSGTKMEEVRDGLNLYLTIVEPLQAIVEEELDKLMETSNPKAAYAIMADPETGNILAVAQRPTYNPNDRSQMSPDGFRTRIAEDVMEPGSIMKPFTVVGALERGIVTPQTRFDTNGGLWYYAGKPLRDSHPMGVLSVHEIIQQSSNIGTAKIALEMGKENLNQTLRQFGFGSKTGIPLKPESRGIFARPENWDSLKITRVCMGQGIAATPLQIVRAYCMLANGGYPVNLRLVDRLENFDENIIEKFPIVRGESIFKKSTTHQQIVSMMKAVTEEGGTAKIAAVPGFSVAGKTGTAEKVINRVYTKKYVASFVGFVPADNPRFVLLVTADEPRGKFRYGGSVSGPFFSSISERSLKYLNVKPEVPVDEWVENRKKARKVALDKQRAVQQAREARERTRTTMGHAAASTGR